MSLQQFFVSSILFLHVSLANVPARESNVVEAGFLQNGVTAHRGSSLEYPENTITAFREAIKLGVDWVETDNPPHQGWCNSDLP